MSVVACGYPTAHNPSNYIVVKLSLLILLHLDLLASEHKRHYATLTLSFWVLEIKLLEIFTEANVIIL